MPQLGDIRTAMKMRESITDIATSVVKTLRPEDRIGTVFSYNPANQMAEILFPGETNGNLVQAHFSKNMRPMRQMVTNFGSQGYSAVGDIVRVSGKPGSYYISDYINGGPGFFIDWSIAGTLGVAFNAGYVAKYTRIGDVVHAEFRGVVNSTLSTAPIGVPLPVAPQMQYGNDITFGTGVAHNPGAYRQYCNMVYWSESGLHYVLWARNSLDNVTVSNADSHMSGDEIMTFSITYQAHASV